VIVNEILPVPFSRVRYSANIAIIVSEKNPILILLMIQNIFYPELIMMDDES